MAISPPYHGGPGGAPGGGGSGSPDTPTQIKNKLESLTGLNRLDASSIKNIPVPTAGMLPKLVQVATKESLTHSKVFSWNGANDFISNIGIPAEFVDTGSYVAPSYYNINNEIGFFGGEGFDPTDNSQAFIVMRLPAEYFNNSQELRLNVTPSSDSGSRGTWVFNGSAATSGTLIEPTRGDYTNTNGLITKYFEIPPNCNDIYVYFSRTAVFDVAVVNKASRYDAFIVSADLAQAAQHLLDHENYVHQQKLTKADANKMLLGLGVGAYWRDTDGRKLPKIEAKASGSRGIQADGLTTEDPSSTNDSLEFSEIVISNRMLTANQKIEFLLFDGGNTGIRVFSGNPTSSDSQELQPIYTGTTSSSLRTLVFNVSRDPSNNGWIPETEPLHICVMGAGVLNIAIYNTDRSKAEQDHLLEVRGGERPDEFVDFTRYDIGDHVYRSSENRSYRAIRTVVPGLWNPAEWQEESVNSLGGQIANLNIQHANYDREFEAIRGDDPYPTFNPDNSYSIDDKVHNAGRNYIAIAQVSPGSFKSSQWEELSVSGAMKSTVIRDRLQFLSGSERLDAGAIKNIPRASGMAFQGKLRELASRDDIDDGDQLSWQQADEFFSDVLGIDCSIRRDKERIRPSLRLVGSEYACLNGSIGAGEPTAPNAYIELVIPKTGYYDRDVILQFRESADFGDRRVWLFDGDPTSGGTEIEPIHGLVTNVSTTPHYISYRLPNTGSENIHIVLGRIALTDIFMTSVYTDQREKMTRSSFPDAINLYSHLYGVPNGFQLNFLQCNDILESLNIGAYLKTNQGRLAPKLYTTLFARGWYSNGSDDQDETTDDAEVVEIVIPSYNLTHDTLIDIRHRRTYSTGIDHHIFVYFGDPTDSTSEKITPIYGTEESLPSHNRTVWRTSPTPESSGLVNKNIHIVMKRSIVTMLSVIKQADIAVPDLGAQERLEIRGERKPDNFSTRTGYNEGDTVYRSATNRSYVAQTNVAAGPWNEKHWRELSVFENEARIRNLEETTVGGSDSESNYHVHVKNLATRYSIANGDKLTNDQANEAVKIFGVDMTVARNMPKYFEDGDTCGLYTDDGGSSPTDSSQNYTELVVPANNVSGESWLRIFAKDFGKDYERQILVYNGDATGSSTEITPEFGVDNGENVHEIVYKIPENCADIHIYLSRVYLTELMFSTSNGGFVKRNLELLTGRDRLSQSAINFNTMTQAVYVSNSGSNSNSGLSPVKPVQTLNAAIGVLSSLPTTSRRAIVCPDASSFNENFASVVDADIYMPLATLTGNIVGNNSYEVFIKLGTLVGDITIGALDTIEINEMRGNVSYSAVSTHANHLTIRNYQSGNITFDNSARGYSHIEIDLPKDATTGAWPSAMTIYGHIGENTYTSGSSLVNELTKLIGDDRLDASAIKNLPLLGVDSTQTIYVSNNGNDANDGLGVNKPKLTLNAALNAAYALTGRAKRVVSCLDASVFHENISLTNAIDLNMPFAQVVGNVGAASNLDRTHFDIGLIRGNVTVYSNSHYHFQQVTGDLILQDSSLGDSYVEAEDWLSGSVDSTSARGTVYFNIVHNQANLAIPTNKLDFKPIGLIGGVPVNPADYARSLETLVGNQRIDASAIKNLPSNGGNESTLTVNQLDHGFTVGHAIRKDGDIWALADSTNDDAAAIGIIADIIDENNFVVHLSGLFASVGHGLQVDEYYWLNINGTISTEKPTTGFVQQILYVVDPNTILVDIGQSFRAGGAAFSGSNFVSVSQKSHGFSQGIAVCQDSGSWILADSREASNVAVGIVSEIVDVDNFIVQFSGVLYSKNHGLTVDQYYWLDESGRTNIVKPTSGLIQQVLYVIDSNNLLIDISPSFDAGAKRTRAKAFTAEASVKSFAEPEESIVYVTEPNQMEDLKSGVTYQLMQDISLSSSVILDQGDITIDLNNFTLSDSNDGESLFRTTSSDAVGLNFYNGKISIEHHDCLLGNSRHVSGIYLGFNNVDVVMNKITSSQVASLRVQNGNIKLKARNSKFKTSGGADNPHDMFVVDISGSKTSSDSIIQLEQCKLDINASGDIVKVGGSNPQSCKINKVILHDLIADSKSQPSLLFKNGGNPSDFVETLDIRRVMAKGSIHQNLIASTKAGSWGEVLHVEALTANRHIEDKSDVRVGYKWTDESRGTNAVTKTPVISDENLVKTI